MKGKDLLHEIKHKEQMDKADILKRKIEVARSRVEDYKDVKAQALHDYIASIKHSRMVKEKLDDLLETDVDSVELPKEERRYSTFNINNMVGGPNPSDELHQQMFLNKTPNYIGYIKRNHDGDEIKAVAINTIHTGQSVVLTGVGDNFIVKGIT